VLIARDRDCAEEIDEARRTCTAHTDPAGGCPPWPSFWRTFAELKSESYVEGVRGKHGGAKLACDMDKVKMGELVRLIDGKLAPIGCASETAYERCTCPDEVHCGLRVIMIDVRNAIAGILDKYSLSDVVTVTMRKLEGDGLIPVAPEPKPAAKMQTTAPGAGRGGTYHAAYFGVQYLIHGDKLKLLAGAEYAHLDGGGNGGDFDGVTALTGIRFSF
jgi:Rrf2 family protein